MKILTLLIALSCSFSAGYGQYIDGERHVSANAIPGLITQLKNSHSGPQKEDLLLRIGYGYLYKDGENKADLDSAMLYAQQATSFSRQINNAAFLHESLLLTSMIYMEQRNMPTVKSMLPAMNDSTRLKMLICLAIFDYNTKPSAPDDHSLLDSAAHYALAAVKLASKIKILQTTAMQWLEAIAKEYSEYHLVTIAEKYHLLMLEYCDSASYPSKARVLSNLSSIHANEGNFYQALTYGINAEKALNRNSSDADFALVYLKLGSLYSLQGKSEQALVYFGNLLANPKKYKAQVGLYAVANSYCLNLRKLNRTDEMIPFLQKFKQQCPIETDFDKTYYHLALANAYSELKRFKLAEKNFLESIRYADSAHLSTASIYRNLGILYNQFNDHEKALVALKIAEKKLTTENQISVANNFSYISQSEAALGNYESAYKYLLKNKTISDSIFAVSKEKHTQELEVQYETQKKEADLRLKEENIRFLNQQATAMRKVTILIIALLAVIIALLFWLFWSKLKSNKVITRKNGLLQRLVKDKNWLLKEMHHRVKNNLHTIMSLLEFQSAYLQDDALEAIRHSQSRIFSMSLIHQKLYQTDDTRTIDMVYYIPELVSYLRESFSMDRNFRINMDIDHTVFHVEEAVPLGLIINETVTNSMKYAFKNDQNGEINISMKASGADEYELIIADNGTGLSEGFDLDNVTSLGFQLIKGLSEQLEARLHIVNENGLKITVSAISVYRTHKVKTMENELKEQMII